MTDVSSSGIRIIHELDSVSVEALHTSLCRDCWRLLGEDLNEALAGINNKEITITRTKVEVHVRSGLSIEKVEEIADLIDDKIRWCHGGHQGFVDD